MVSYQLCVTYPSKIKSLLMKKNILIVLCCMAKMVPAQTKAPAYPLITHDPYFSIWSFTDELTGSPTKHWTGEDHSIQGIIKVDGKFFRVMGRETKHYQVVLPASDEKVYSARYTFADPGKDWYKESFSDSNWPSGMSPYTSSRKNNTGTTWNSKDKELWVRREFVLDKIDFSNLNLRTRYDDDAEVYLNGEEILNTKGVSRHYRYEAIKEAVKQKLKKGKNVLAMHVTNTGGAAFLDAGLCTEIIPKVFPDITVAQQKTVSVTATQTEYIFTCGPVNAKLIFTSPLIIQDLSLVSRPVSYITYRVESNDGGTHDVSVYLGASSDLAVNTAEQEVSAEKYTSGALTVLKVGSIEQPVLGKKGDDLRIDWGYLYVAATVSQSVKQSITRPEDGLEWFIAGKERGEKKIAGKSLVLNSAANLGKVGTAAKEQMFMIGYDDNYSIQYFNSNLKPWWKLKEGVTIESELNKAAKEYTGLVKRCETFNNSLYAELEKAGGKTYADLCILAYRQSIAAHKLVKSPEGEILFLSKENFSNGSINTVDVTYPSAP